MTKCDYESEKVLFPPPKKCIWTWTFWTSLLIWGEGGLAVSKQKANSLSTKIWRTNPQGVSEPS
jgi:hypothetical protein